MLGNVRISMIAAVVRNRVIGNGGGMGWTDREDMQHFYRETVGGVVIMGRRTMETLPPMGLRDRINIVMSTSLPAGKRANTNLIVVRDLIDLERVLGTLYPVADDRPPEVHVIGGGEIYRLFLPYADRLVLTELDFETQGHVTFPEWSSDEWLLQSLRYGSTRENREKNVYRELVRKP